ncbi:hypothetical protein G7Y79_00008g024260 [Physcia stellaris]|nr:hypothetical protein G7Y79_00008g024260 [Physcia stellaris]
MASPATDPSPEKSRSERQATAVAWLRSSAAEIASDPSSPYYNPSSSNNPAPLSPYHYQPTETSSLLAFQQWEREAPEREAAHRAWLEQDYEEGERHQRRAGIVFVVAVVIAVLVIVALGVWTDLLKGNGGRGGGGGKRGGGWKRKNPAKHGWKHGGIG